MKKIKKLIINNSGLQAFRKCQFLFEQYYLQGRRSALPPSAAQLGTEIHAYLEEYYSTGKISQGHSRAFYIAYEYIKNFPIDEEFFEIIEVEQGFEVPLTDRISVAGTLDLIVRHKENGEVLVVDHKTTSALSYLNHKLHSNQFTCYMWALNQKGLACSQGMINGISTSTRPNSIAYQRWLFQRTPHQLEQWAREAEEDCNRIIEMVETGKPFSKVLDSPCYEYRDACFMLPVCSAVDAELQEQLLNAYLTDAWKNFKVIYEGE